MYNNEICFFLFNYQAIVVVTSTCGLTKKVLTGKNMRFSQTDMNVVIVLQKVNG